MYEEREARESDGRVGESEIAGEMGGNSLQVGEGV
jgi:hypothetical protein